MKNKWWIEPFITGKRKTSPQIRMSMNKPWVKTLRLTANLRLAG